jgi:FkbM family methyltransferase
MREQIAKLQPIAEGQERPREPWDVSVAKISNFTVIESVYGRFVVNRHCAYQAEHLIKTGYPHIQDELFKILTIGRTLPENCIVIDAGANIGLVSVPFADTIKARGGVVYAFEVQRMLFYALCGTAALNDLENLQISNSALGAFQGSIKVPRVDYGVPQDFGMISLVDQNLDTGDVSVPICTVDSLGLAGLDFIKIDVEGMEIDVLAGASGTIRRHLPWCWIEFWKTGVDPIKGQFKDLPYRFYKMDNLNLLCAPNARVEASAITIKAPES